MMQRAMPLMSGSFVLLAVITTANIVLDILSHLWPVEVSVDQFHGFIHAHMASQAAVMLALHYQFAERGITGDPDFAFAEEHPISVHNKRSYTPFKGTIFRSFVVQLLPDRIAPCFRDDFFLQPLAHFHNGSQSLELDRRQNNLPVVSRYPLTWFEHVFNRLVVMPPLFRAVLRTPTQCIWLGVLGSRPVNDVKIKAVQLKSPPDLPPVKWFVLGERLQPTMIRIDTNLMSCTLEISTPFLEGRRNCKQFLVVYLIINLMLIHFARMKSNRVQTAFERLRKDSADCEI